jgi:SAM-dependent methyltransferase
MSQQELHNKRGEIEFRRKLFRQQVEGERIFEDEFDSSGMEEILRTRMTETLATMQGFAAAGVQLSPYLEIGAERGQRSLALENDLGVHGAALDLSFDLLRSCAHYADRFGESRLPLRICADAYRLPFRTGSLPFVFCYQTLHHFPALDPILAEIHRVLAPGGHFFFAEEPYRKVLHLGLVKSRGSALTAPRGRLRKLLRSLFVEEVFNEEEHGVIEKHDTPLPEWRRALSIFAEGNPTLELDRFSVQAFGSRNYLLYLILSLLGGRISGLYRKEGVLVHHASTVEDALTAPAFQGNGSEEPLAPGPGCFVSRTGQVFRSVDGVALLMTDESLRQLYPELVQSE